MTYRKPNFLYIGPNKAASTWIYEALRHHPEVFLARAKELHYFDLYYSLGPDWYFGYFKDALAQHRIVGEISHDYLYSEDACERIASELNDVRLMVCLREPVERAFSEYLYMIRQGYARGSFADALKQHPSIVDHSMYGKHLLRYKQRFGAAALLVTTFDSLKADPAAYFLELCDQLGIRRDLPAEFPAGEVLSAAAPRSYVAARLAKSSAMIMRRMGLAQTITAFKSQRWLQHLLYRPYAEGTRPSIDPRLRLQLREQFAGDVGLLDREFGLGIGKLWGYQ